MSKDSWSAILIVAIMIIFAAATAPAHAAGLIPPIAF